MKQQTSIHVQPVKGGSEQHNKREKELDYIRPELSHLNEYWEKDTQTDRLENIKSRYFKSSIVVSDLMTTTASRIGVALDCIF